MFIQVTKPMKFHLLIYSDIILCNIKYNLQKVLSSQLNETHLIFDISVFKLETRVGRLRKPSPQGRR